MGASISAECDTPALVKPVVPTAKEAACSRYVEQLTVRVEQLALRQTTSIASPLKPRAPKSPLERRRHRRGGGRARLPGRGRGA